MVNKPKVVLDTNILLVSISSKSKYHWIFSSLLEGHYALCVSNEILLEYEEIITSRFTPSVAKNVIRTLLFLDNVVLVTPYFKWDLIVGDKDDNKFVDCYLISNSEMLVTHDKHFDLLKALDFPQINVIGVERFKMIMEKG